MPKFFKYDIPPVWLTVMQIKAGDKGICGHIDISQAYPGSGHYDPGPGYPKVQFLAMVKDYREERIREKQFEGVTGGAEAA